MTDAIGYGFAFDNLFNQPFCALRREFLPGFQSTHHRHDFPQIWYCYKGHCFHQVEDQVFECEQGSVVVIPIGMSHQFRTDTGVELMYINIHYDLLSRSIAGKHDHTVANLFLPAFWGEMGLTFSPFHILSEQYQLLFERTFSWLTLMNYTLLTEEKAVQIWDGLEQIFSADPLAVPCTNWEKARRIVQDRILPILKIVNHLNNRYPEKITNEMFLRECNISRSAMYRYFKQLLGSTPSQFLQFVRVRRAHLCLRDTTYSLQELAELCGFYDSYHLSRLYSKCTGKTVSNQRACMENYRKNVFKPE